MPEVLKNLALVEGYIQGTMGSLDTADSINRERYAKILEMIERVKKSAETTYSISGMVG